MTAFEYMAIKTKERSFEEFFEGTDLVGITFPFLPYFEKDSILSINDGRTIVK